MHGGARLLETSQYNSYGACVFVYYGTYQHSGMVSSVIMPLYNLCAKQLLNIIFIIVKYVHIHYLSRRYCNAQHFADCNFQEFCYFKLDRKKS